MPVNMIPVVSSNLSEIGYDETTRTAYIRFTNNTLYVYRDVPPQEFESFRNAPSLGSYLHRNFKNVYPYERIE
jgi:hypothetical protein